MNTVQEEGTPKSAALPSLTTNANQKYLSAKDMQDIEQMFRSLDSSKFWKLSNGTIVEKQVEKMAMESKVEHPCHSMILDPRDPAWLQYFTKEELAEIKGYNPPTFINLPKKLSDYLDHYKAMNDLDAIWEESTKHNFHPTHEPELHWMNTSVARALDLLFYHHVEKNLTESDLMKHVWVIIDHCFNTGDIGTVSGETASKASSHRVNAERSLGSVSSASRRQVGMKTGLLFMTRILELGVAEAGRCSDVNTTKTLYERGMKLPKMLKDMFVMLLSESPEHIREIRTFGFAIAGLNIMPLTLDSPNGYICRITSFKNWLHFPTVASDFVTRLTAIFAAIYHTRTSMERTLALVSGSDVHIGYDTSATSSTEVRIPPCFSPSANVSKKRKLASELESNSTDLS
ncbi:hypothetical protein BJV82DRAFT_509094 [Fennellomyces sp. T-0311]|nr:hypothetical protein BJV82DRAFT_509094 [Fennellomyces sp. T-0311]